ncbi:hypothetical protein DASC09_029280 [Saccharomycopsis crataegensis]|uniref:C2H2-type domain-containing protein n=1 Tax=Saccharomycopsis crataegensis TaxID=43959 RepID=A0AAV5QLE1_9ASCO|nr:hypothetical protein DASC09_029280 [Saccharomycopsis crataegensis]
MIIYVDQYHYYILATPLQSSNTAMLSSAFPAYKSPFPSLTPNGATDSSTPRKISLPPIDSLLQYHYEAPSSNHYSYTYQRPQYYPSPVASSSYTSPTTSPISPLLGLPTFGSSIVVQPELPKAASAQQVSTRPAMMKTIKPQSKVMAAKQPAKPLSFEEMTSNVFFSNPNFEKDIRKHKCVTCDKRFKSQGHLNRHKQTHKKSKKENCVAKQNKSPKSCKSVKVVPESKMSLVRLLS